MGLVASWIGVKAGREQVLDALGMMDTGEEIEALQGGTLICAEWPSGWFIVAEWGLELATSARLKALSMIGEAVGANVSETVMFSEVSGYRDGQQTFAVIYDCEKGFEISGHPPAPFAPLHDAAVLAQKSQDDADLLWDVPVDLMAALCGYRPDQSESPPTGHWTVLEWEKKRKAAIQQGERKSGWLAKLFGG